MKLTRRPFLKTVLASIAGWFIPKIAVADALSTGAKPVLFTFYTPCRVWVSPKVPDLTKPKSAKHWLNSATGEVYHFKGEDFGWVKLPLRQGYEAAIEGKEIGFIKDCGSNYNETHTSEAWTDALPALKESDYHVKCEGCGCGIDLHLEHVEKLWDVLRMESCDGTLRDYRLCKSCFEKASTTYEI